jgi:predicted HTH transcriptional regulator
MLDRPLPDLSEQDFASLVTNGVAEGRDIEFKGELPGGSDSEVKEFLADVTSLANTQGGDLIYGIEDRGGVATGATGIVVADLNDTLLRLENMIRDGIEPRLTVRMQWVPLTTGNGILVLRIPASLVAPHRVRFKASGKFWSRNSRGKYEMDVHELRHAFMWSFQGSVDT